jgi:hypothetical protein
MKKKGRVRFIQSPTGAYKLGYNIGDVADLDSSLCVELIEKGFAEPVETRKRTSKKKKPEVEL